MENLEGILSCILLIVKLCSAMVPLVTAIQSQTHKHKSGKNNEATLTSSENAEKGTETTPCPMGANDVATIFTNTPTHWGS